MAALDDVIANGYVRGDIPVSPPPDCSINWLLWTNFLFF